MLKEFAPGVYAWQAKDMTAFRSYAVQDGESVVLVDPVALDENEEKGLAALGRVVAIVLTHAWHERDAAAIATRHGVPVYAHPDTLADCESKAIQPFPAHLPATLEALEAVGGPPGQVAFYLARDGGTLLVGDTWHNIPFKAAPWFMRLIMKHVFKLRDGLHPMPPIRCQDAERLRQTSAAWLERPLARLLVMHGECVHEDAKGRMQARLAQGV